MVRSDIPRQVFTDPSCWPVLRRIVAESIHDHRSLLQTCRNVRVFLLTDPDIRDHLFHTIYGLPFRPPSLDYPRSWPPRDRTPPDTETYYREQALQQFAPSLVRCVHTEGNVEVVRDGYMVTFKSAADGSRIGWTVWYLPQWHDVQLAVHMNRDDASKKSPRADPLAVKDMPMPPRPAGAFSDQNLWRWDTDLGVSCAAIDIRPEDNLVAVATVSTPIRFHCQGDKPQYAGRRHRVYFFQLRPTGLARRGDKPSSTPVGHPDAARPYIDFIETVHNVPACPVTLKLGPNGKVGLLLHSREGQERGGPLVVWDWRRGECVGYFPLREGKVNYLDFAFYTKKHVVLLEACAPPPPLYPTSSASSSTMRAATFKTRLAVMRLGGWHSISEKIIVPAAAKVTSTNRNGTTMVHVPHTWVMSDLRQDRSANLLSLELPPTLDRTLRMSASQLPLATLVGKICLDPPTSNEYFTGSLAFSIGCKNGAGGTPVNSVVRGTLPAGLFASMIPLFVKTKIIKRAISGWVAKADLPPLPYSPETIRLKLEDALMHRSTQGPEDLPDEWDEVFLDDFRFTSGKDMFRDLVACADELAAKVKRGPGVKPPKSLAETLGGEAGLKLHGEAFAHALPPLACTFAESAVIPFEEWCSYADIFITPSGQLHDAHGSRLVYLDLNNATALAGKNLRQDLPAELTDRRCYLVMRNYATSMFGFPHTLAMAAAKWFWKTPETENGNGYREEFKDKTLEPVPHGRPARYVKCQGKAIHPPWLGAQVLGSAYWQDRDLPVERSTGSGAATSSAVYTELRVPFVADKNPIKGVHFDGQTIVISQADKVLLISF